jgi:Zn-dependent protease
LPELNYALLVLSLLVLLGSLTVHETAHAWAADRLGDPTARLLGRISFNPVVHIDLVGTVLLPVVAVLSGAPLIGWAKPVPVNTARLGRMPRDFVLVAAAGPASNILLAFAASLVLRFLGGGGGDVAGAGAIAAIAEMAFRLNLLLAVFNLIPVPPLDGGNMLGGLLPGAAGQAFHALRPYGIFILYGLILTGTLWQIIGPPYFLLARLLTL